MLAFDAVAQSRRGKKVRGGVAEDAIPTAKSIVDKAIDFHGGLKALGRDLALVRNEESEMILEGEKISLQCEWQYQPPDKRAFQAVAKIGSLRLHILQALVGDKGWVKIGPALAVDLSPAQVAGLSWEHSNHVRNVQLLAWVDRDFDMNAPSPISIDKRDAWQITFTAKKNKKKVTVFFDKTSGQVIGDEAEQVLPITRANDTTEKVAKYRVLFKTFTDVDGMKMPETGSVVRDGTPVLEVRKSRVRIVDAIDPKLFVKPK